MAARMLSTDWLAVGAEDGLFLSFLATAILFYATQTSIVHLWGTERAVLEELLHIPQTKLVANKHVSSKAKSRDICDDINLKENETKAVVFWGSQGGTAEAIACRYASELSSRFAVPTVASDLADYDHVHLEKIPSRALIVFVLATYGEGDPTDNALAFLSDLRSLSSTWSSLKNLRYAIFGLGNKNYRLYNKVALDVDHILASMGAVRVGSLGLGDDSKGATEEDFICWKSETAKCIAEEFGIQEVAATYAPQVQVQPVPGLSHLDVKVYQGEPQVMHQEPVQTISTRSSDVLTLPIEYGRELIDSHGNKGRHCVHLEFSLRALPLARYETGDYLRIWPINPEHEVVSLLTVLGLWKSRKNVYTICPLSSSRQTRKLLPSPTTPEVLFRHCLEICGPVSREVMSGLVQFISDETTKESLQRLVNDRDVFRTRVTSRRLTLAAALKEVLEGRNLSSEIPLAYIVENLKKLQPRSYSISSSALVDPKKIAVTALAVAEVVQDTHPETYFKGVTSHYLLQLQQEHANSTPQLNSSQYKNVRQSYLTGGPRNILQYGKIFAQIRHSEFKLPQNPATPITMIGSGTGIAPFRAFVQERMKLKLDGHKVGKTLLIVGHRSPNEDFYYSDVWREACRTLDEDFELQTAFSRTGERTYVQDMLKMNADIILKVLKDHSDGRLYICGSSAMAVGVKVSLKDIWRKAHTLHHTDEVEANEWISKLQNAKRLQEDSWG